MVRQYSHSPMQNSYSNATYSEYNQSKAKSFFTYLDAYLGTIVVAYISLEYHKIIERSGILLSNCIS